MNDAEYLFSVPDLPHVLEARQQEARQAIEEWDPDKLLVTGEANVVDYLIAQYSVVCPVLHRDQVE